MRGLVDAPGIYRLLEALGREARAPGRVYLTGGATAVLMGWRQSTVDVDLKLPAVGDEIYRSLARLKEELSINVEEACPSDFIPELPGWEERSLFIRQEGKLAFFHYDPCSQALSKIERGHERDLRDVASMLAEGLVERGRLLELYERVEPLLFRYPAISPGAFRAKVEKVAAGEK